MLKTHLTHLTDVLSVIIALMLIPTSHSVADIWLNEQLSMASSQRLSLMQQHDEISWQLAPEIVFTQSILNHSKLQLGSTLLVQKDDSDIALNAFNITTALSPYWSMIAGRQAINYIQADLFQRSLSSHDNQAYSFKQLSNNRINYSQGIQAIHRLGFVEQQFLIRQNKYSTEKIINNDSLPRDKNAAFKQDDLSLHYRLSLGVPGYLVGPVNLTLESQEDKQNSTRMRAMIGSALQLPITVMPGDLQWAFQYASELSGNQHHAWQTSLAWLGFIPNHKLGFLWSHTDAQWFYSDDFQAASNHVEFRYQWLKNQTWDLALGIRRITDNRRSAIDSHTVQGQLTLSHHF